MFFGFGSTDCVDQRCLCAELKCVGHSPIVMLSGLLPCTARRCLPLWVRGSESNLSLCVRRLTQVQSEAGEEEKGNDDGAQGSFHFLYTSLASSCRKCTVIMSRLSSGNMLTLWILSMIIKLHYLDNTNNRTGINYCVST